jgi:hypothetical protein
VGWGILGLIWLVAGLLGGYRPIFAWGGLLAGWIFLWRENFGWFGELKALGKVWRESGLFGRLLASVAGVFAGLQLVYALAPPAQWGCIDVSPGAATPLFRAGSFRFYYLESLLGTAAA